jgi:prenylcysteine oxidase/farnesylcysteine lyase
MCAHALTWSVQVTDIVPHDAEDGAPAFHVKTNVTALDGEAPFDQVFFAAPWHLSPIEKGLQKHFNESIPYGRPPALS